jgi:hypothetical protein
MSQNEGFKFFWVAKLSWAELQVGFDGLVHIVKWKIYSKVEHKKKSNFKMEFTAKTCRSEKSWQTYERGGKRGMVY